MKQVSKPRNDVKIPHSASYCLHHKQHSNLAGHLSPIGFSRTTNQAQLSFQALWQCWDLGLHRFFWCPVRLFLLRATAGTAIARLDQRNSVCLSVRLSITRVNQSKTVQARITKSSSLAAWKTLVSGSVKLSHKFHRELRISCSSSDDAKWDGGRKKLQF